MVKPRMFIGSSRERLAIANAVKDGVEHCADAVVWDKYDFPIGKSILDGLLLAAEQYDFALFVFGQDDSLIIRGNPTKVVRENVLFELGLFIGRIGRERAIWLSPHGNKAPDIISDLQGIIHLTFDEPNADPRGQPRGRELRRQPDSLPKLLGKSVAAICKQITKLGPRNDREVEDVMNRRILCVASAEYSKKRFAADIEYIHDFFSPGEVTQAHGISAAQFEDHFAPGKLWDLIHLGVYVDRQTQHMLFDPAPGRATRGSLSIGAIESMIKDCGARLVIIITCDSLAFGARLARFTNVIAGYQAIAAGDAISWAKVFYQWLAYGKPVSSAFNTAQQRADPGLILLSHKDVRFPPEVHTAG